MHLVRRGTVTITESTEQELSKRRHQQRPTGYRLISSMGSRRRAKVCIDTMPKVVMICLYVNARHIGQFCTYSSFCLLFTSYRPILTLSGFSSSLTPTILTNVQQAHIKSSLIGASVSVPITNGNLALGTWQGIWFLEFRNEKQRRKVVATVQGVKM